MASVKFGLCVYRSTAVMWHLWILTVDNKKLPVFTCSLAQTLSLLVLMKPACILSDNGVPKPHSHGLKHLIAYRCEDKRAITSGVTWLTLPVYVTYMVYYQLSPCSLQSKAEGSRLGMASVIIRLGHTGYASHSSAFDPFVERELIERTNRSNQGNKWQNLWAVQLNTLSWLVPNEWFTKMHWADWPVISRLTKCTVLIGS